VLIIGICCDILMNYDYNCMIFRFYIKKYLKIVKSSEKPTYV
jgi:hypothetical protein